MNVGIILFMVILLTTSIECEPKEDHSHRSECKFLSSKTDLLQLLCVLQSFVQYGSFRNRTIIFDERFWKWTLTRACFIRLLHSYTVTNIKCQLPIITVRMTNYDLAK